MVLIIVSQWVSLLTAQATQPCTRTDVKSTPFDITTRSVAALLLYYSAALNSMVEDLVQTSGRAVMID